MSILQSAVNALGVADTTKDIAQAVNNLINSNNAMDVGSAAGELAASLATGAAVHGLIRPAMQGIRLGLAVSGQIWKWEALTKAAGIAGGVSSGILIDYLRGLEFGINAYDWIYPGTNTHYLTARNYLPRKDPLVLDPIHRT